MASSLPNSLHAILHRFDAAWNGPAPPRIEDFELPPDSPNHLSLLVELIRIDMEHRLTRGEKLALDEYRRRFPACSDGLPDSVRLAAERVASREKETKTSRLLATSDAPPLPRPIDLSSRLVGEYEVLGPLGAGGMGEVYKARHRRLDKLVALKLLPAGSQRSREIAERFQREMKAVGALDHPNVVEAHDAGEQSGIIYLAMKLIDGVDLQRLVKERGPLPIGEACELVRQAALGLHYLHQRGMVHRDIKPSNLMRTPDGTVKVLDLGLARWRLEMEAGHSLTESGRLMGTPDFLAPEQIENAADVEARADLYGLGGTLFYLLTGQVPFVEHKSLFSKLEAHRSQPPPDVRTLRLDVPADLAALLHRLLAKKPAQRLATAAEVAAALAPFASAPHRPPELAPRPRRKRWPRFFALACGITLVGCLILIVGQNVVLWRPKLVSPTTSVPVQPLQLTLDVVHQPAEDRFLLPGKLGEQAYDTLFGDAVTVKARLTPPAYAFLIAFRPDGVVEAIFPDRDDEAPPRNAALGGEYMLNDGAGLEVFAVIASSQTLPSFKDWWARCRGCPWGKFEATPGVVWRADGIDDVEDLFESGRGKPPKKSGRQAVKTLAAWLRTTPGIEAVQALGVRVEPKPKR